QDPQTAQHVAERKDDVAGLESAHVVEAPPVRRVQVQQTEALGDRRRQQCLCRDRATVIRRRERSDDERGRPLNGARRRGARGGWSWDDFFVTLPFALVAPWPVSAGVPMPPTSLRIAFGARLQASCRACRRASNRRG